MKKLEEEKILKAVAYTYDILYVIQRGLHGQYILVFEYTLFFLILFRLRSLSVKQIATYYPNLIEDNSNLFSGDYRLWEIDSLVRELHNYTPIQEILPPEMERYVLTQSLQQIYNVYKTIDLSIFSFNSLIFSLLSSNPFFVVITITPLEALLP